MYGKRGSESGDKPTAEWRIKMNFFDHIITYNRDEVRQASESVSQALERADARRRNRKLLEFIGGAVFLIAFSLLMTYTIAGWMDAL